MHGDVSHPEPGSVSPDRMGTGAVSWGARVWGSWGRERRFLAQAALVTQQVLLLEPRCERKVNYEVSNRVTAQTLHTQTSRCLTHAHLYFCL